MQELDLITFKYRPRTGSTTYWYADYG